VSEGGKERGTPNKLAETVKECGTDRVREGEKKGKEKDGNKQQHQIYVRRTRGLHVTQKGNTTRKKKN